MHEWLISSLTLLVIWFIIYIARPFARKEMFWVSLLTMPFGLTEFLFVPEYWNPPSLFDLAAQTSFDFESLVFCFASGGIASVVYEAVFKAEHSKLYNQNRMLHKLVLVFPIIVFIPLYFLSGFNPIYSVSIAMLVGGIATLLCRPDLRENTLIGGLLFTGLYFAFFLFVNLVFPEFINAWNLSAISGILIVGVPLEELMFAFTFGMIWSSAYECFLAYKLEK